MNAKIVGDAIPTDRFTKCSAADVVYKFLTNLIEHGNWVERQFLRTVRGFVKKYQDEKCK